MATGRVKPRLPFVRVTRALGSLSDTAPASRVHGSDSEVAIPWLGSACGECEWCIDGWETLCPHQVNTGYGRDGTYSEMVVANAKFVVKVPHGIDPLDAAR
jgi:propanol-preferring alcohol dehydrogenase